MRLILLFLFFCQAGLASANPLFKGFTTEYDVTRNNVYLGISTRQLFMRDQGRTLDYGSSTTPKGLVALLFSDRFIEHSLIRVTPQGLQPHRYDYQRTGGKKEITFQASFDWKQQRIHMSNTPDAQPLSANTQDLLSFQLALMEGLYQGQRQFSFHIVDHKRIQLQTLEYDKTIKMRTSHGELDVLQLEHKAEKSDYRFTFWCAKQLHYLPIMIQKTEQDGDITKLKLKRLNDVEFRLLDQADDSYD